MNKLLKKLKHRNKFAVFIFYLLFFSYLISYVFFAKNIISLAGVETKIRYIVLFILLIYFILYSLLSLINIINRKYGLHYIGSFITLLLIIIFVFSSYIINLLYSSIGDLKESDKTLYTSYLIMYNEDKLNENDKIGMISDEDDNEGNVLAKKLIEKNNLKNEIENYDDYLLMVSDLYKKEIDAIFVPSNYVTLFASEEGFENIETDTTVIYTYSEELENKDKVITSNKKLDEPVSVLVMGVDSTIDGLNANAAFNGDTLMLVTFNPDTLTATMFSIPRDTFVPIVCRNNNYAKINSAAAYGTSCVIDTVSSFTGIDIDYYVKINFKGVVDLVDALGGVEVNVEKPDFSKNQNIDCKGYVCEQNSNRSFGSNIVYVPVGEQTLNGEQALAYARNRHQYLISDLARIGHQQDIVTAISKKLVKVSSLSDFEKVLNAVSKNIATNMSTNQILSSYNVIKDMINNTLQNDEFLTIEKSYLEVYNLSVYQPNAYRYTSALGYYKDSLEAIKKSMNINLNKETPDKIKTFSFSFDEEYENTVNGKGYKKEKSLELLPSFVGQTRASAQNLCTKWGITCNFKTVNSTDENYNSLYGKDYVASQSVHEGVLLLNVKSMDLYVNGASNVTIIESKDENNKKNDSNNDETDDNENIKKIMGE